MISKKELNIDYNKNGKDKLLIRTEFVINALKENISSICNKGKSKFTHHTVKNFLDDLDVEKILKIIL
ncbi:MAG: hypothetical protein E7214_15065 [Clostridium sp.]|nr:hypothetical protein [Clostridium sp.]